MSGGRKKKHGDPGERTKYFWRKRSYKKRYSREHRNCKKGEERHKKEVGPESTPPFPPLLKGEKETQEFLSMNTEPKG